MNSSNNAAMATANIMMSENAGDWVTLETIGGFSGGSKNSFITLRTGHVINTRGFGHEDIEQCDVVRLTYFAGRQVEVVYIKSSVAAVNEVLNIKSVKLLKATKEKKDLED